MAVQDVLVGLKVAAPVAATIATVVAARRDHPGQRARWYLLSAAAFFGGVTAGIDLAIDDLDEEVRHLTRLVTVILALGSAVLFSDILSPRPGWARRILDSAIVLSSLLFVTQSLLVSSPLGVAVAVIATVACALGLVTFGRSSRAQVPSRTLLAGGFVAIALGTTGVPAWRIAWALFAAAGIATAVSRRDAEETVSTRGPLAITSAAIIAAVAEAGWRLVTGDYMQPAVGVAGITVVLFVLVRQLLAIFEGRATARDLEAEIAARVAELQLSEVRFQSLVHASSDVVTILDAEGFIQFQTPSVQRVLGFVPDDFAGRLIDHFAHPEDVPRAKTVISEAVARPDRIFSLEWRLRRASGEWAFCETMVHSLLGNSHVAGIVLNTRDITERRVLEDQLTREAFHDPLTGLANRLLLRDRTQQALARAARGEHTVAIILVDLDDFKAVNDGLGHAAGDLVLTNVARRLEQSVRPGDTVARLGGDEFAVLVDGAEDVAVPEQVAARIQEVLRLPMLVAGHEVFSPGSIGVAAAESVRDADELLRNADVAMYIAKGRGKAQYATFAPEMHEEMKSRLTVANELRHAVNRSEFTLRYQPVVDLKTSNIKGFEALIRWRHPTRGLVSPSEFIPLAETTGIIVPLGKWVLEQATKTLAKWQEMQPPGVPKLSVTVNLSGRQFREPAIVDHVREAIEAAGVEPSTVVLELTESVLLDGIEGAIEMLTRLKETGVRLALDDFGTGYSSLSYLRRFPIDILKIDKSFVTALSTAEGPGVVRSILRLGDTFKLATLAEGIELPEQLAMLRALGCGFGQGYLFDKPLRLNEATKLVRESQAPVDAVGSAAPA